MSTSAFDKSPGPSLDKLMDAVLDSGTTLELLSALFTVIKPAQIRAIRDYMELAQPIVDQPTLLPLLHQLIDREDEIAWGQEAIAYLSSAA
ncbi:hypothetical protein K0U00_51140, partial [Paenibacillus sepulcri]|nr:hypothetical protein [Paenibacillus sepulcri]